MSGCRRWMMMKNHYAGESARPTMGDNPSPLDERSSNMSAAVMEIRRSQLRGRSFVSEPEEAETDVCYLLELKLRISIMTGVTR